MYTEQQIRGLAINFLRQHYKLRPRSGTSGTQVDHKPHFYKNVKIDARLAYQQPNLEWFIATVEATGLQQPDEVLYRVNWFRIGFDALFVTLTVVGLYLAGTQVQGRSVFADLGRPAVYGYLLLLLGLAQVATMLLLSRFKEYRYIYAVAQFKRFYANAQWIAYDREIFAAALPGGSDRGNGAVLRSRRGGFRRAVDPGGAPALTRRQVRQRGRAYEELRRQCLAYGFGLLEIQPENKVRWVIEPSHLDQFAGSRNTLPAWVAAIAQTPPFLKGLTGAKKKPLLAPAAAPPAAAPEAPPPADLADPLAEFGTYLPSRTRTYDGPVILAPAKKGRTPWYKQPVRLVKRARWRGRNLVRSFFPAEIRRRPGYYEQPVWKIVLFALLLFGFATAVYLQSEWTAERRPGEKAAVPDLERLETAPDPEASDAVPYVETGEYDHELTAREAAVRSNELDLTPAPIVAPTSPVETELHFYRYDTTGLVEQSRSCGPVGRADGRSFLIVEAAYPTLEAAQQRAARVARTYEIPAIVLVNDCLYPGRPGYVLYVGDVYREAAEASLWLRRYQRRFGLELAVEYVD